MAFGTAIQATFGGDTGPLQAAAKRVEMISAGVNNVLSNIGIGLSSAAAIGAFVALGKGAIALAGRLTDVSQNIGINVEALQALENLHGRNGVAAEQFAAGLAKVKNNIFEAAMGGKAQNEALEALGLNAAKLMQMAPERQYEAIAKAVAGSKDQTAAFNAASALFGDRVGPKLMGSLRELATQGFEGLLESEKKAGRLLGKETTAALDRAGDAIEDFKKKLTIQVGEIIVNFRSKEGIELLGLQLLGLAGKFGAWMVDSFFDIGQKGGAHVHAALFVAAQRFRFLMVEVLKSVASGLNAVLPDKFEINVAGLDKLKGAQHTFAEVLEHDLSKIKFDRLSSTVGKAADQLVAAQQIVVDNLNRKVDLGKDTPKIDQAAANLAKAGQQAGDYVLDASLMSLNHSKVVMRDGRLVAAEIADAGNSAGEDLSNAGLTWEEGQRRWSENIATAVNAWREVSGAIAGVRGSKQFDALGTEGLEELIRQNDRKIEEMRRKVREGITPELAGSLEIGRIQAENMNARQDLNQRTGFQQNLNRLGVDGARALYDPFVFEELLKRFDASRPLEQKSVDTLDEIRRGQERLLSATVEQTDATADVAQNLDRGLSSLAAHLKDR
jgi:hypothetical protein